MSAVPDFYIAPATAEQIQHYVFMCDVVDIAYRMPLLKGSRIKDDAAIRVQVACRLVWNDAAGLFHVGYQGFPAPADDRLLKAAMAADALLNPDDYNRWSGIRRTVRRVFPRDDDMESVRDFVDPQHDADDHDNLITVSRRGMRLRERASLAELDVVSAFYLAQIAADPSRRFEVGEMARWLVVS